MVALVLVAEPSYSVVVNDFSVAGDVPPAHVTFLSEHFAQELGKSAPGVSVSTTKNTAAALGVERQKQLLGCDTGSTACVTDLASALGADALVSADVAKLERTLRINLRVHDGRSGTNLYSGSASGTNLEAVTDELTKMASAAGARLALEAKERARRVELLGTTRERPADWRPWSLVIGGAAVAVAGAVLFGIAESQASQFSKTTIELTPARATSTAQTIVSERIAAGILVGVGVAAAAVGLVWRLASGTTTSVALSPSGAMLMFTLNSP
ncbi:MAG: hypothetical protein JNK82_30275 [Myxococcaceae bacterium]|nr:hypothetical protein [Myxococcaceae bacterium]